MKPTLVGYFRIAKNPHYTAFGRKVTYLTSSTKVTKEFTGKELDDATGLFYFGARYYDPDLGMWTSPDPRRQFPSPYEYAGNNPVNRVDPDGKLDMSLLALGFIQIGGAVGEGTLSFGAAFVSGGDNEISLYGMADAYFLLSHGADNLNRGLNQDFGGPASNRPSFPAMVLSDVTGLVDSKTSETGNLFNNLLKVSGKASLLSVTGDLLENFRASLLAPTPASYDLGRYSQQNSADNTVVKSPVKRNRSVNYT